MKHPSVPSSLMRLGFENLQRYAFDEDVIRQSTRWGADVDTWHVYPLQASECSFL